MQCISAIKLIKFILNVCILRSFHAPKQFASGTTPRRQASPQEVHLCFRFSAAIVIRKNEDADIAAKAGLDVAITNMRFPVTDLLTCVNQLCVKE